METAQKWQQFVAEVDDCRSCVVRLEGGAGEETADDRPTETSPDDLIELQVSSLFAVVESTSH